MSLKQNNVSDSDEKEKEFQKVQPCSSKHRVKIENRSSSHVVMMCGSMLFYLQCRKKCKTCSDDGQATMNPDRPFYLDVQSDQKATFYFKTTKMKPISRKIIRKDAGVAAMAAGGTLAAVGAAAANNKQVEAKIHRVANYLPNDEQAKDKLVGNLADIGHNARDIARNPLGEMMITSAWQAQAKNKSYSEELSERLGTQYVGKSVKSVASCGRKDGLVPAIKNMPRIATDIGAGMATDARNLAFDTGQLAKNSGLAVKNATWATGTGMRKGLTSPNMPLGVMIIGGIVMSVGAGAFYVSRSDTNVVVNAPEMANNVMTRIIIEDGRVWGFSVRTDQQILSM